MTYLQSRSVASLAFDENRAEIRGIIVWGRICCSWGFAFKWVAVSAEALQLLYRGFPASSLFMNKKSGMKPEEWVVFVLLSALRQNASFALFYLLLPFLCSHTLSFSSPGICRAAEPRAPLPDKLLPWELLFLGEPYVSPTSSPDPNLTNKPQYTLLMRGKQPLSPPPPPYNTKHIHTLLVTEPMHPCIHFALQQVPLNIHDA